MNIYNIRLFTYRKANFIMFTKTLSGRWLILFKDKSLWKVKRDISLSITHFVSIMYNEIQPGDRKFSDRNYQNSEKLTKIHIEARYLFWSFYWKSSFGKPFYSAWTFFPGLPRIVTTIRWLCCLAFQHHYSTRGTNLRICKPTSIFNFLFFNL